jgi:hypothetical protein
MANKAEDPAHIEAAASDGHDYELKSAVVAAVNQHEHELTLTDLFRNHKAVVWWCFFWAMAAVGWWAIPGSWLQMMRRW